MGVRSSVVGRSWPGHRRVRRERDGDAAIGLTARNATGRGRASTGYACATRPPVRRARQSAAPHLPCATDDVRRPTPRLALQNRFAVGRPSPRRRCRRRMGAAEQSRAEQASLRFYASQLQASARIGSHPTHILPARRQQLIIITRFLTKTKKNEKKTHRHPHQSIGSVRHVEAYWRRRRASPPAGPHPDGLTL